MGHGHLNPGPFVHLFLHSFPCVWQKRRTTDVLSLGVTDVRSTSAALAHYTHGKDNSLVPYPHPPLLPMGKSPQLNPKSTLRSPSLVKALGGKDHNSTATGCLDQQLSTQLSTLGTHSTNRVSQFRWERGVWGLVFGGSLIGR